MKTDTISQLATHLQLNKVQTMYLETKVEQLITEARLEELEKLPKTGIIGQNGTRQDWTPYPIIEDRLSELKEQSNE